MKYISYNLDFKINPIISSYSKDKKIALTDHQILELQELFLTEGIHYIAVSSVHEARKVIYAFLKALRCYDTVGCFTKSTIPLKHGVCNLYNFLETSSYNANSSELNLDGDLEFIWIEYENNIDSNFFEKIKEYNKSKQIPMLVFCVE